MTVPSLSTSLLFQPAPSGVGPFGNVPMTPPPGSWLAVTLQIAATVQLPTTAWQSGGPERTILAIEAVNLALVDANVSQMAQGGFLQTAAAGTVTYTTPDGTTVTTPVTPDPSNTAENPTGAPGWLDDLAEGLYLTTRLAASYATGPLAIAKITPGSIGPYTVGGYHVATPQGATYKNVNALTIPSSIIAGTGGVVTAVSPGLTSTILTTQSAHGLSAGDSVYLLFPPTTGVSGLDGVFAVVTSVTTTTLAVSRGSSGTYTSGGTVYACTVATMVADEAGPISSAAPGQVSVTVTQNVGVFCGNPTAWSGANWESNADLMDRCLLALASRSPNGPAQAFEYFARSAYQILAGATQEAVRLLEALDLTTYTLTNGPVRAKAFGSPSLGTVTTVVASTSPAGTSLGDNITPGVSQLPISSITNASPAVVTCSGPTSLASGETMTVTIAGAEGIADVNGTWVATYVTDDSFSIPVDTTSSGTYTGGGQVEGGDLGQIDVLLQAACVPNDATLVTVSATALPITPAAVVIVPKAYVQAYTLAVLPQLQTQIESYAIGGNAPTYEVAYDDIVGALEEAGVFTPGAASVVRQIQSLSLNGGGVDVGVPFPGPFYEARLVTPTVTVLGI